MDEIETLAEEIGRRADEMGLTLGVAESLTGGLVVQTLAKSSGASEWLRGDATVHRLDGDPDEICAQARRAALIALRDRLPDHRHQQRSGS